ncbi:MAG TPA: hypothetical protein VN896_00930 [Methylomirabilota bacterium]|nr:hypothetical protein [Methylomirabilota bacterium]
MKRLWMIAATLVAMSLAPPLHAETQTWFGFNVGISGGSPAPLVVLRSEPHYVMVNDVYVVDDDRCGDDIFRADNLWWRMRGGYWYRAASWRGPWMAVDVRRVPERVLVVPARHWKHHPRHEGRTVIVMNDRHDNGRHRGHSKGRGHHGDHDDD